MEFPAVKFTNTWAYISTKNALCDPCQKNCLRASATLRHKEQTERNAKQRIIGTVFSILCMTDSLWRPFARIGSENKAAENPTK